MSTIAIIGTPGAGKTTFLSVLAMRYHAQIPGKPWLSYLNGDTQRYVSDGWDTLQGMEWPDPTAPGRFPRLAWEMHMPDGPAHQLSVRDPAGQDILAIYDAPVDNLNDHQKDLKTVITSADAVLFLVNLREVINATSQKQIDKVEIALSLAIQDILNRQASVAVVLTQYDSYRDYLASQNPAFGDPRAALCDYLPQVGGRLLANPKRTNVFYVAAVAETVPVTDPNGKTYRRPKPGFTSSGLSEVMGWVGEIAMTAQTVQIGKEVAETIILQENIAEEEGQKKEFEIHKLEWRTNNWKTTMAGCFVISCFPCYWVVHDKNNVLLTLDWIFLVVDALVLLMVLASKPNSANLNHSTTARSALEHALSPLLSEEYAEIVVQFLKLYIYAFIAYLIVKFGFDLIPDLIGPFLKSH